MMAEAEKDGKPLPMANGKARDARAARNARASRNARAVSGLQSSHCGMLWLN